MGVTQLQYLYKVGNFVTYHTYAMQHSHSMGLTFEVLGVTVGVVEQNTIPAYDLKLVAPLELYLPGDTYKAHRVLEHHLSQSDGVQVAFPEPISPPLLTMADMAALASTGGNSYL